MGTGLKLVLTYELKGSDPIESFNAKSITIDSTSDLTTALGSASSSAVTCSFAGGCTISVTGLSGLASALENPDRGKITVCGEVCKYNAADSDSNTAKCTMPEMVTSYSVSNFKLKAPTVLTGELIASDLT